ncbi:MAG: hypothetical protein FJZ00_12835, partial [Candidatus Sericytochromatia bacterium]|nr:hypothetical protein [Candidatus Tanganyikabacteria bacterium]
SGHLQHIATVLVELAESMDAGRLIEAARTDGAIAVAQRLGYLLDLVDAGNLVDELAAWVKQDQPRFLPLVPGVDSREAARDLRWRLLVNSTIEPDL